jgi:hypothetical protein
VIERYAIGGAVGATFYLEPAATLDVDVFVESHTELGSRIASPECFSSSRPAHSISNGYKKSSRAMVWVAIGSNSSDNS